MDDRQYYKVVFTCFWSCDDEQREKYGFIEDSWCEKRFVHARGFEEALKVCNFLITDIERSNLVGIDENNIRVSVDIKSIEQENPIEIVEADGVLSKLTN